MRRLDPGTAAEQMRAAGLDPLEPYPGSAKKWRCRCTRCGDEVYPRHSSIQQGRGGCGRCGKRASDEALRLKPNTAIDQMRAAGFEPLEPYKLSRAPWLCRCTACGTEVRISHSSVKQGHGCKRCEVDKAAVRRKASNAANAVLTMQLAGLEPLEPYPGTVARWRCLCLECLQEVAPTHDKVQQTGRGCPTCSIRKRGIEHRLDAGEAAALMRAAGLEPLEPYPTSTKPWLCQCRTCGRKVDPTLTSVKAGTRCRYCSGKDVISDEAIEVMRAAGVEPLAPYPGANNPWSCVCRKCGKHPSPSYGYVRRTGSGCGYCSGRHVDPADAEATMKEAGFEPLEPYPGSLKPWTSRCSTCGKTSGPWFAAVKSQGTRCAYCQGTRVDPEDADSVMRSAGLEPLERYPGALTPWRCRCTTCGREVAPVLGTIRAGGGCRYCATRGLDLNAPALLYVITHGELEAHKVGIGSPTAGRLDTHRRHGWSVYRVMHFDTGQQAFEVEAGVLRWLRLEMGLPPALTQREMPQRGETETVHAADIELPLLWREVVRISGEAHSHDPKPRVL